METLNGISLAEFPYRNLKRFEDLLYYDGPLLSHFRDDKKNDYLFYWIDNDDDYNRWLIVEVKLEHLYEYLQGQRSLLSIFQQQYNNKVITVDINEAVKYQNSQFLSFADIPQDFLPTEESVYSFSMPPAYDLLFEELTAEMNYVQAMRSRAVFFKLDSLEAAFGRTLATDDVTNFLSKFTRSFQNYAEARYKMLFQHLYETDKALSKAISNFIEIITPRVVNLKYNSFGVDLATDSLSRNTLPNYVAKWQGDLLEQYKNDVIDFDYSSFNNLSPNLKGLTPDQLRSIFHPIIQLSNSPNFIVQVSDERKGGIKKLRQVTPKTERAIFPKPPVEEEEPIEMEFTNLVLELEKGTEITGLTINKIRKALLSLERNSQTTLRLDSIVMPDGEVRILETPIEYMLSVYEGVYEVKYEPLDITLQTVDRRSAQEDLKRWIGRLYYNLVENTPDVLTPKETRQKEHLAELLK